MDVTVVIAAWDAHARDFLERAVSDVASQQPAPPIVVVDNASSPPLQIAGAKVLRSEQRRTIGAARNLGLTAVETEYVMFWDADDLMLPGTIARLRAAAEANRDAAVVACGILVDGGRPHHWPRKVTQRLARWRRLYALLHCVSSLFPTTGSALMRTQALRASGGFGDERCGEDWVAGVSMALRGRVTILQVPGRIYHQHGGSISASRTWRDRLRAARAVRRRLQVDAALPRPLRAAAPLLLPAQWFVLLCLRPMRLAIRAGGQVARGSPRQAGHPTPAVSQAR